MAVLALWLPSCATNGCEQRLRDIEQRIELIEMDTSYLLVVERHKEAAKILTECKEDPTICGLKDVKKSNEIVEKYNKGGK